MATLTITLSTAASLTGLSKRTLWRRVTDGLFHLQSDANQGDHARVPLEEVLPLSRPVLSTVAVLTVVSSWNAFLLPLLVLVDPEQHTLPIGVNNISSQYSTDTSLVLAYTVLSMVPAVLFYLLAERQIVSGLTAGAVKE